MDVRYYLEKIEKLEKENSELRLIIALICDSQGGRVTISDTSRAMITAERNLETKRDEENRCVVISYV